MAQNAQPVPRQTPVPIVAAPVRLGGPFRFVQSLVERFKNAAGKVFSLAFAPSVSIMELTAHEACAATGDAIWLEKMARNVKSNGNPTTITNLERL